MVLFNLSKLAHENLLMDAESGRMKNGFGTEPERHNFLQSKLLFYMKMSPYFTASNTNMADLTGSTPGYDSQTKTARPDVNLEALIDVAGKNGNISPERQRLAMAWAWDQMSETFKGLPAMLDPDGEATEYHTVIPINISKELGEFRAKRNPKPGAQGFEGTVLDAKKKLGDFLSTKPDDGPGRISAVQDGIERMVDGSGLGDKEKEALKVRMYKDFPEIPRPSSTSKSGAEKEKHTSAYSLLQGTSALRLRSQEARDQAAALTDFAGNIQGGLGATAALAGGAAISSMLNPNREPSSVALAKSMGITGPEDVGVFEMFMQGGSSPREAAKMVETRKKHMKKPEKGGALLPAESDSTNVKKKIQGRLNSGQTNP